MSFLYKKGQAPTTIRNKLSAISFWHQLNGKNDPCATFEVRRTLLGMKKKKPLKQERPALTKIALNTMIKKASVVGWSFYETSLIRAMILCSFHGFLRPGEMVNSVNALKLSNLKICEDYMIFSFRKYKHSKGLPAKIKIKRREHSSCPVKALENYLLLRGPHEGNIFCLPSGKPVSYTWYRKNFNTLVVFCRLNGNLQPHSVRIGAATYAADRGVAEERIRRMGRWASSAYRVYIKTPVL
ncbi:MAG: hypothetical protein GY705_27240, partial [Bacteroidetes bacterium]|nr:hypothetical protein [Bacteroidota bacterium]